MSLFFNFSLVGADLIDLVRKSLHGLKIQVCFKVTTEGVKQRVVAVAALLSLSAHPVRIYEAFQLLCSHCLKSQEPVQVLKVTSTTFRVSHLKLLTVQSVALLISPAYE